MVFFLLDQFAGIRERRPDIFLSHSVLPSDFLNGHPTCQAADDTDNRHPGAANNRLAVLDPGVDNYAGIHTLYSVPETNCLFLRTIFFTLAPPCAGRRHNALVPPRSLGEISA